MSWRVVGDTKILGVLKGGVITQKLPQAYAQGLVDGGHIVEVVEDDVAPPVVDDEPVEEAPVTAAELPKEGD